MTDETTPKRALSASTVELGPVTNPTAPAVKPFDLEAGRFEARGELGRGGTGVDDAFDHVLGRSVAIKHLLRATDTDLATDTTVNAVTVGTRATAMPALLQLAYAPRFGAWSASLGIGIGGAVTVVQSSAMSSVVAETTRMRFAADAFAGIGHRLGAGTVSLELRYLELALDETAASGQLGGLEAAVGFALPL